MTAANPLNRTLLAFRQEFLSVGVFSMVSNLMMLTPSLYMLQVYDRVLLSQSAITLAVLSLVALFFFAVMGFAEWVRSRVLVRAGVRFDEAVNQEVFRANFAAALAQTGRSPSQAFTDLTNMRQFLTGNGIFAFFDAPWTPIYIGVLFLLHPWLGGLATLFALTLIGLTWLTHRVTQPSTESVLSSMADLNAFLYSKLRNAEVVEAMGMREGLRQRWRDRARRALAASTQSQELGQRMQALMKFTRLAQQSLMLGAGALLVIEGELSIGGMIAASVLVGRALAPIDLLAASWKGFFTARQAYHALGALLAAYPRGEVIAAPEALQGEVRVQGLVATATGRAAPILDQIDAHFAPGEITVIIGPSGSGKSTLARCLVGIWSQREGAVLIDGLPIDRLDRTALGRHIGYLPQDVELLEGSIAENIARFGPLEPEAVIEAAKRTGIHEMILRFPMGYDTPVGPGGASLSGGQRQRIGLARALYKSPQLIVLDEPNSNLDDVGETALSSTLQELKALGRTVVVVSHRPQTLAVADRILLLVEGRVRLHGPRDAVLTALSAPARHNTAHWPTVQPV
ncbi:MAG: type I secretion system permease/ATPase [Burkholderiales bacterium]|nr:type I secretion system permease/ATPase [Burkholderiales bacterium]